MSVEWLLELHALNEAGRFDDVVRRAKPMLASRPRDYAVRLQVGRALVALGDLKRAKTELLASVKYSKGLAAWPWFYLAALHARSGSKTEMTAALNRALAIDPKVENAVRHTPWFAAYLPLSRGEGLAKRAGRDAAVRTTRQGSEAPKGRARASPRAAPKRKAPGAPRRATRGGSSRRRGGG